eukprot:CAMPEP_0119430010 /NCGR_PEP_ID=MMETSP1335-20130426/43298_1 /TAXON_ID=259385 /ORGANISM="Chrysoculter rhomboideus, Strain RCC1486" /LENGTH=101 /DNA_ID=CAMNT_0007455755 /DNA_START=87 /DNA_END=390 /DNA_ORIENTATION=-
MHIEIQRQQSSIGVAVCVVTVPAILLDGIAGAGCARVLQLDVVERLRGACSGGCALAQRVRKGSRPRVRSVRIQAMQSATVRCRRLECAARACELAQRHLL